MGAITEENFNLLIESLSFESLFNDYELNNEQLKTVLSKINDLVKSSDLDSICYTNVILNKCFRTQNISIENIEMMAEYFGSFMNWNILSQYQMLSESFIEKYKDKVNWFNIGTFQILSESFIEKYQDKLNWNDIIEYQKLSENFIEKYKDKFHWNYVPTFQKLSESFIEKHIDILNLRAVLKYQKLSESFIEKHFDILPKVYVLKYQKLSESFLEKHIELFDNMTNLDNIIFYQDYSNEFAEKHNLLKSFVTNRESYNRTTRVIKANKKFECYKDYFIGYKAIRVDRYSFYNFQYQYLPNNVYESKCDCTSEDNSFGLSVSTYEYAKQYLGFRKGIIVKCKVYYKDIGRIVHGGDKIRCFKIEILD